MNFRFDAQPWPHPPLTWGGRPGDPQADRRPVTENVPEVVDDSASGDIRATRPNVPSAAQAAPPPSAEADEA